VQIYNAGLKCAARGSVKMQDPKNRQKLVIWAPSHNFVGLYHRTKACSTIGKKLVKQRYLPTCPYGELRPTSGWDQIVSLGHPS